jgi:hypothetical protein
MKWWLYLINISDQSKKCKFTENHPRNGNIPEQFYLNWCNFCLGFTVLKEAVTMQRDTITNVITMHVIVILLFFTFLPVMYQSTAPI